MSDNSKKKEFWIEDFLIKTSPDRTFLYIEIDPLDFSFIEKVKNNWGKLSSALKNKGIHGILKEPEIVEDKIILAKGSLPRVPIPEKIELFKEFVCLLKDKKPEISEDKEKEDLRDAYQTIVCAEKDEIIGKWYPPVPGVPGTTVFGELIEPPEPETEHFIIGENLYIDENNFIRAKEAGVISIEDNKIEVYPEYTIEGDVDFFVGNVNFVGKKLVIKGDIKFGFKVNCKGDLELQGGTENKVFISVKGNFNCQGIIRGEDTTLRVTGSAEVNGVEHAKIEVEGNLIINNYLIFANIYVIGDIIATQGKGIIYGGMVRCSGNIEVKILGNESQTLTKVFAGYKADIIERYSELVQKETLIGEVLKKLKAGLDLGKKLESKGKLTEEKRGILEKIKIEFEKHLKELEKICSEIRELKKHLSVFKNKVIKVLGMVYPGVIIGITDKLYTVSEEKRGPVTFYLESGIIQIKK